jgi:predicted nucleotidyltransferase
MKSIESIKDKQFLTILADVKREVLKLFGSKLRQLILYGSYARNEQDPESDIDIMILVDGSEDLLRKYTYKIADIMTDLSLKYDTFVSLTEETYGHYNEYLDVLPFFRNIYYEGIEIYGKKAA